MQDHAASRERQILLSARCHLSANVCGAPKSSRTFLPWQVAGCKRWKQSLKSNAIPVSPCYLAWPRSRLKWKSYIADLAPRPGKRPVVDEGNSLSRPAKRLEHYLSPNSTGSARIGLLSFAYGVCSVLGSRLVLAAIIHQGKLSSCPTLHASFGKKRPPTSWFLQRYKPSIPGEELALLCLMAVCHFQSSNKSSRMQDYWGRCPNHLGGCCEGFTPENDSNLGKADHDPHEHQYVQCVDKSQLQSHRAEVTRHLGCYAIWDNIGDVTLDAMHLNRSICPNAIRFSNVDSEVIRLVTWRHDSLIWNFCGNFMEWWCSNPFNGSKSLLDVSFMTNCGDVDVFQACFEFAFENWPFIHFKLALLFKCRTTRWVMVTPMKLDE